MLPTVAYFEFLLYDSERSSVRNEETVDLSVVEVGKMYELVVTTFRVLYRLCLGDVVKVVEFHYTSPQVEFLQLLMLRDKFGADILEFLSFFDMESDKKQLKILVEVKDTTGLLQNEKFTKSIDIRRRCCSVVEDGLRGIYQVMRARGDVGPLSVSIVRRGSFDLLLEEAIRNGSPSS
ncbi:hypothetical protein C2S51_023916 [Perilla frutescens var. frutescens]|nr:hypothetical protein C2S51_023916 [Perilla frutescens var. frutescens]